MIRHGTARTAAPGRGGPRAKGRRVTRPCDLPVGGRRSRLVWTKRRWRCDESACPRRSFTEAVRPCHHESGCPAGCGLRPERRWPIRAARWSRRPATTTSPGPSSRRRSPTTRTRCCRPSRIRCRSWVSTRSAGAGRDGSSTMPPAAGRPPWTAGTSGSWTCPAGRLVGRVCSGRSRAAPPKRSSTG